MAAKAIMHSTHFAYSDEAKCVEYITSLIRRRGQFSVAPFPNGVDEARQGWIVTGIEAIEEKEIA